MLDTKGGCEEFQETFSRFGDFAEHRKLQALSEWSEVSDLEENIERVHHYVEDHGFEGAAM